MLDLPTPTEWLLKASEAQAIARTLRDLNARQTMLNIAAGYEKMARHAALKSDLNVPHGLVDHY